MRGQMVEGADRQPALNQIRETKKLALARPLDTEQIFDTRRLDAFSTEAHICLS